MSARIFIVIIELIKLCFYTFESIVIEKQRKKPLPQEVSDIYEKARYETYLKYAKDNRKVSIVAKAISLCLLFVLTFSNVYSKIDIFAKGNVYVIYFLTYAIYFIVESIEAYLLNYYVTFKVEEKYGFNKKTPKEFHREFFLNLISEVILMSVLSLLIIWIGENLNKWTNNFTLSFIEVFFIGLLIVGVLALFIVMASFFSIFIMKKQYTFTLLEEGALKDKINALQKDVKKSVKKIYVYDESKKSTSKNAFLLKFLWIREFGIADNFLLENSEEELLAVLSHEIGHLKHKKTCLEYSEYILYIVLFLLFVYVLCNISIVDALFSWIQTSFAITSTNYYINIAIISNIISPILFGQGLLHKYNIRTQEYEADQNACKNGYGEALIQTFKKMSSDELINVNPSSIIEFLEYDHPGMYHRIKAMQEK